ncbi:DsbA family protein [Chitinimonas koreensis]|uniref:DsbA family protein n=1 Tax=Chitinimonas koreensis TaxID=356302 RepID=UPI000414D00B|nr:DsbA family protein [Chitinimonas koreensis]QNM96706.1 thioredoxin domain-containing protein [Chitinimonas koreensis]
MRHPIFTRPRLVIAVLLTGAIGVIGWTFTRAPDDAADPLAPVVAASSTAKPAGPPWLYGRADARFTVIEYADLECPYCRTHFPALKRWIDVNPDVNWQWHHLPLPMHEPAATAGARLAECAGETGGHAAFWQALEWYYAHTRGNGQGPPQDTRYPDLSPAVQQCLGSDRPDAVIRSQAAEAAQAGIAATPALRLRDRTSGKSIVLHGPVEGDALLSAIDLLNANPAETEPLPTTGMPADVVGMPR